MGEYNEYDGTASATSSGSVEFADVVNLAGSGDIAMAANNVIASMTELYQQKVGDPDEGILTQGYLFFRPGNHFLTLDVVVPAFVTLFIAPGAVLEIDVWKTLTIKGRIKAGLHQIFRGAGTVVFRNNHVPEIYPEWWGACGAVQTPAEPGADGEIFEVDEDPELNTQAIQNALDTAVYQRVSGEAPIPVVLSGSYAINGPLTLIDPPDVSSFQPPFILRSAGGAHNRSYATLRAVAPDPRTHGQSGVSIGDAPMLTIQGPRGFLIENVGFDAGSIAPTCLNIVNPPALPNPSAAQTNVVRHCSFQSALTHLVYLGPILQDYSDIGTTDLPTVGGIAGGDLSGTSFESCHFLSGCSDPDSQNPEASGSDALVVRAGNSLPVQVLNCVFIGSAAAMIRIHGGTVRIENCMFYNNVVPPFGSYATNGPATVLDEPNGVDVFLALEPNATQFVDGLPVLIPLPIPLPPPLGTFGPKGGGAITVVNSVSWSYQFLATYKVAFEALTANDPSVAANNDYAASVQAYSPWNTILINVRHYPPQLSSNPQITDVADVQPPSILWLATSTSAVAGRSPALILLACQLGSYVVYGATTSVYGTDDTLTADTVLDLGTTFDPVTVGIYRALVAGSPDLVTHYTPRYHPAI